MTSQATDPGTFDRAAVQGAILDAALPHVAFDGWTHALLEQAAKEAGHVPVMALRVFPGGPRDAIEFWSRRDDRRVLAELERRDLAAMKVRERIALAIRLRLEMNAAHREAVRRGLGYLALPFNAGAGAALLWRTVDSIWYAAGDNATDFNFYTKRGLLAGVYSATVLYWLEDKSAGHADTWAFLDRRIADVMRVPKALGDLGKRLAGFPNPFSALRRAAQQRRPF